MCIKKKQTIKIKTFRPAACRIYTNVRTFHEATLYLFPWTTMEQIDESLHKTNLYTTYILQLFLNKINYFI